jgi:hypothetical protein
VSFHFAVEAETFVFLNALEAFFVDVVGSTDQCCLSLLLQQQTLTQAVKLGLIEIRQPQPTERVFSGFFGRCERATFTDQGCSLQLDPPEIAILSRINCWLILRVSVAWFERNRSSAALFQEFFETCFDGLNKREIQRNAVNEALNILGSNQPLVLVVGLSLPCSKINS